MRLHHSSRSHLPPHFAPGDLPLRIRFGPHAAVLRPLQPGDAERLLAFFASHSEQTIYQRYGFARGAMTPEQALRLVSVDQTRDAALGVFEPPQPEGRLIAIGRYCRAVDSPWAEAAFVVHEERRCLGIATTLLAALVAFARARGLERLVAEVRQDNTPMLHVFDAAGATFESLDGTAALLATLMLHERNGRTRHV